MPSIAVIGAGYVGLVTGAGLARLGHQVALVEKDPGRLTRLQNGQLPFHEPGLAELVDEGRRTDRLTFHERCAEIIPSAGFIFLAVHTPPRDDGDADTQFVFSAVLALLPHLRPGATIVTKSTVPVGTGDEIERLVSEAGVRGVEVVSNPEFLREGSAIEDFMEPDRIVVGATDHDARMRVAELYAGIEAPVLLTTRRSAELAKYAANALLAARISFINEIGGISEAVGADVDEIARIVGADRRIGPSFLKAGLGWGGSCFPKDLSALAAIAARQAAPAPILQAVIDMNRLQRERAVAMLLGGAGRGSTVGVLGLAFKPHTDDLRGSPSLDIIARLLEEGLRVRAHDPAAMGSASAVLPTIHFGQDAYDVADGSDALLLATEWPEYLQLDWARMRTVMRGRLLLDGRNVLHGGLLRTLGFDYRSFGRAEALLREPASATVDDGHGLGIPVGPGPVDGPTLSRTPRFSSIGASASAKRTP